MKEQSVLDDLHDGKYFTVNELLKSATAKKLKIENLPPWQYVDNLQYLIERLDEIREGFGQPIIVTSGYRCPALNKAVGGVSNSAHKSGLAADLKYSKDLWEYLVEFGKFDQLILETSGSTIWIHYGIKEKLKADEERQQILNINASRKK